MKPDTARQAPTDLASPNGVGAVGRSWSPWRVVVGFGVVSLAADMVYEGARSVTGPLLASLGASAVLVGLISGAGEAMALLLRIVSGSWATAVALLEPHLRRLCPNCDLRAGVGLYSVPCRRRAGGSLRPDLGERIGKAVRSPAKTALLAHAAAAVGLGRGFGVHQALDQVGAVAGPPWWRRLPPRQERSGRRWRCSDSGSHRIAGAAPVLAEHGRPDREPRSDSRHRGHHCFGPTKIAAFEVACPTAECLLLAAASAATTAGLVTFAVISYHLSQDHVVSVAAVPLIYAAAMAAEALAALGSGWLFDRTGGRVLVGLPLLVAAVPVLAFAGALSLPSPVYCSGARPEEYLIPLSKRCGRARPSLEAPPVRCSPLFRRSRHRRWSHGRCTVRAITPDTDCGCRSCQVVAHTADRDLASASKDPNRGSRERFMTRLAFSPQYDRHRRADLAPRPAGERATPRCARWSPRNDGRSGCGRAAWNDRWQPGEWPGPLLILPLLSGAAAVLEIQLVEHMLHGRQD